MVDAEQIDRHWCRMPTSYWLQGKCVRIVTGGFRYDFTESQPASVSNFSVKIAALKVHKIENFFDSDFGICVISLLVMSKY